MDMIKVSKISITPEEAAESTIKKLSKKKMFGLVKPLDIEYIKMEDVETFYVPFYVAMTENIITSRVFKDTMYHIMFAVEGYTGESGITVGVPQYMEENIENMKKAVFINPKVHVDEAQSKIIECAKNYVMRKNRQVPKTSVKFIDIIWKPTYMIPVIYNDKDELKILRKFVDAESGYNVYRYDLIWEKMLKHIA